ncbi:alpha-ketoglutarate-dependent sulfonate dioxygenase [Colletotrichum sojae]|uniref:Alpha-ketoglutarate-dependent sulfonate dioxygenase n=1 Tax=Colletotrichum sojae TaxID=2175907 RepID=A0A8H6IZF5_9PEZI|nr:alpha-ketoglutarate-dependent sulfonate dioxygenase [Colletotrichum sojae]
MPSLFNWSRKAKEKEAEAEAEKAKAGRAATPPPTYADAQTAPPAFDDAPPSFDSIHGSSRRPYTDQDVANLANAFSSLRLATQRDPDVAQCLAHLKLLYAIQTLKEEIGYTDGLWDLWDTRAGPLPDAEDAGASSAEGKQAESKARDLLGRIREKRWAVFLARAADRYETWWKALSHDRLCEKDMDQDYEKYLSFPAGVEDYPWTADHLPPLDVLMVWHAHMLNPRAFLEDSMRWGRRRFWTTGMPWEQVNGLIDGQFNYNGTQAAKASWEATTGRAWHNVDEPAVRFMSCPTCKEMVEVPWTTCGLPELFKGDKKPGLIGKGYGDGDFTQLCTAGCNTTITQRFLSVAKMVQDTEDYLEKGYVVPGAVLDPKVGMPIAGKTLREVQFPNRLLGFGIADKLRKLLRPGQAVSPSMDNVRYLVEEALADNDAFSRIQGHQVAPYGKKDMTSGRILTRVERFQSRKMMARYWENHSIFALDLVGATMRQGVFVDKMYKIDWLHDPNPRGTMDRLIQKYDRFMAIMTEQPMTLCVPTLDVDLAWHTHQLAPKAYYSFSVSNTPNKGGSREARFIDHNDKIDEDRLSSSFETTSKMYLDRFGEVYSECVCGYCEGAFCPLMRFHQVRSQHELNSSSVFGRTKGQKAQPPAIETFESTAKPTDPSVSVHISTHNAVRSDETPRHKQMRRQQRNMYRMRLDAAYDRASRRAAKKGKKLPSREEYYAHWGSRYHMYGPCMYPAYLTAGIYQAGDPGIMHAGYPGWAACAQGLCGTNDISAGGCGGPGGCTNLDLYLSACGAGMAMAYGGAGCGGGGGGGCGGGGGS